jgi:hypothetical protein
MTTLDEKALEAAIFTLLHHPVRGAPGLAEAVIRAYLDALPPAQRVFLLSAAELEKDIMK